MDRVVALGQRPIDRHELEPDDLEPALLESGDDPPAQLALNAIGLDEDECSLGHWISTCAYRGTVQRVGNVRRSLAQTTRPRSTDAPRGPPAPHQRHPAARGPRPRHPGQPLPGVAQATRIRSRKCPIDMTRDSR